tara:strand:- start:6772 stop:7824 length:1053 start_codon:yes stop_codon:yes gene_type:complete
MRQLTFPFSAIIGQKDMKLALILNVIDTNIGGVLIMGDRGTGKSTTIRALIDLLPPIPIVKDDPYNSHPIDTRLQSNEITEKIKNGEEIKVDYIKTPMVDLPLGATEDRVCGTIDIERALKEGEKSFEPGLLARANRGILYVDEVNLLEDHLVDVLLDSAASNVNVVEREGMSIRHPANFILIGSGNPEEGELRPQLLDRFGMYSEIRTVQDPTQRVRIADERTEFDNDPVKWTEKYQPQQVDLRDSIVYARDILPTVSIDYELRIAISELCARLDIDGLRGDLVLTRAAKAHAAFKGESLSVDKADVRAVVKLCMSHRLRKDPLDPIDSGTKIDDIFEETFQKISSVWD